MTKADYYAECLAVSMVENGVVATPEQIEAIAKDVAGAYENIGLAFYSPPASDQINHEKREMKKAHEQALAEALKAAETWKLEACRIARVDPRDAYLHYGEVYRRTR